MTSVRAYTSMATVILQTNMYWRCKASSDINSCSLRFHTLSPLYQHLISAKGKQIVSLIATQLQVDYGKEHQFFLFFFCSFW